MQALILNSVLMATFVIPALVLRGSAKPDADYRRVLQPTAVFVAAYVLALLFVYPRLF
jgi:hypothetical protein